MQHTYQGEALGIFYLPAHIALGTAAMLSGGDFSSFNAVIEGWHGPINVLENSPHTSNPSPW
jgi:hypothetical protein